MSSRINNFKDKAVSNPKRWNLTNMSIPTGFTTLSELITWFNDNNASPDLEPEFGTIYETGTVNNATNLNQSQSNGLFYANGAVTDMGSYERYALDVDALDLYFQNPSGGAFDIQLIFVPDATNAKSNPKIIINSTLYTIKNMDDVNLGIGHLSTDFVYLIKINTVLQTAKIINVLTKDKKLIFDTVAEAQAATWLEPNDVIEIHGYTYTNDGKGFKALVSNILKPYAVSLANSLYADIIDTLRIGNNPNKSVPTANDRDAVRVERDLEGATDCHAYADGTIIDNVTDSGTYGTFDATTILKGDHAQNHIFAFQDRISYQGDAGGTLGSWGSIIWSDADGCAGDIGNRYDLWIKDTAGTISGNYSSHIGIYMENFSKATSNAALNIQQNTGYTLYAPNEGEVLIGGETVIKKELTVEGVIDSREQVEVTTIANPTITAFMTTNSLGSAIGTTGDNRIQLVSNGSSKCEIGDSTLSNGFHPTSDNGQPLGLSSKRWAVVYAAIGTINTSDGRDKTCIKDSESKYKVQGLTKNEIKAGIELAGEIGTYKLHKAIEEKGDNARKHHGLTVQRAMEIMKKNKLEPFEYGFICYDEWEAEFKKTECLEGDIVEHEKIIKTEKVIEKRQVIEIINKAPVLKFKELEVIKNITKTEVVKDEKGNIIYDTVTEEKIQKGIKFLGFKKIPKTYEVPILEEVEKRYKMIETKKAGSKYGFRYNELNQFLIACLLSKINNIKPVK